MTGTVVSPQNVLLIEDNPGDARLIREMLAEAGTQAFRVEHADRLSVAFERLGVDNVDVVLLDLSLPDSQGLETFLRTRARDPVVPIVVLSGLDDETVALRAVQEGAQDYLVKGRVDSDVLVRAIRYAIERRAVERLQREFLAMVTHELRNPLAALTGFAQTMRATSAYNERAVEVIINQSRHLDRLISDLLDVARMEAGRLELRRAPVDLIRLVDAAVVQAQATTQTHTLRAEFPHSLVSGTWDPDRVQQVLENLLSNAIKYSPEGGEIVVKVTSLENEVQVSITDQGTGIAEDVLPNLFRRFYRIRTPKTLRMPGLGLGLYITKSLVEAHGGEIRAESTAGVGSTFTFTLPTG